MHKDVTVIPQDNMIIVDGLALFFVFSAPHNMHALQWHDGAGHIEWHDDLNHPLSGEALYEADVMPFVEQWQKEKARLEALEQKQHEQAQRLYNSSAAQGARIRTERDIRLAKTDFLMASDYPLTTEERLLWQAYRQALRDITKHTLFPWFGDVGRVPWPKKPFDVLK